MSPVFSVRSIVAVSFVKKFNQINEMSDVFNERFSKKPIDKSKLYVVKSRS